MEAGDGARTHDPQLGKLMLYQLSYARVGSDSSAAGGSGLECLADAPGEHIDGERLLDQRVPADRGADERLLCVP